MRRAILAVLGTALGTTLMIGAKLGTRPVGISEQQDPPAGLESAAPGEQAAASPGPAGTSAPGQPSAPAAPAGAPTTKPAPPPTSPGLKNGTFAGTAVTQRYGTIKVTIVVGGGKITDVTATYPTGGETGRINARAIPKLRQEVLTAQSASVATVSGATYTSNAYKQSLQAAIAAGRA
ncbi:hypothetical protein Rhe02_95780 [Rhizocola hellebori]|uniref:FMN-binding domain-containing protein n=1 Tax=Rhizocola hellebori TaxID=1392758 RepID=A0A8J3QM17_9ACTN|nr:FMN-binding protein [Rhizocola hellebori]GIH11511.1 hypothetical protein Rhe02_95780 [Rhizocola hellebori]